MIGALPRLATAVNLGCDAEVLRTIRMAGVGVAIWSRKPSDAFQDWLDALPAGRLPRMRRRLPPGRVRGAVAEACAEAGAPQGAHRDRLVEDVGMLAGLAADALGAPLVEVRLDASDRPAGSAWRLDAGRGRLLCALRGPGPEYGPARPDGSPASVHVLENGAAGLFRGLLWPGRELCGIVHRAAAPEPGQTRLLLVVDAVDEAGRC